MSHVALRPHGVTPIVDISSLLDVVAKIRAQMVPALHQLIQQLEACSSTDAELDFGGLMKAAQQLLELDDTEMARTLNVARPTIGRWIRGFSSPHTLSRKAIASALTAKARTKIKLLEA